MANVHTTVLLSFRHFPLVDAFTTLKSMLSRRTANHRLNIDSGGGLNAGGGWGDTGYKRTGVTLLGWGGGYNRGKRRKQYLKMEENWPPKAIKKGQRVHTGTLYFIQKIDPTFYYIFYFTIVKQRETLVHMVCRMLSGKGEKRFPLFWSRRIHLLHLSAPVDPCNGCIFYNGLCGEVPKHT